MARFILAWVIALCAITAEAQTQRIRVVAANLSSGSGRSWDAGHGLRILRALKPDIVLAQEFNFGGNTDAEVRAMVSESFGPEFKLHREPVRSSGHIPNAIITRWPIKESGEWDDQLSRDREFVWARIDIPGPIDLWAVSLHLLTNDTKRPEEAQLLVNFIRKNVPERDYLVVGGDLNTDTASDRALRALRDVVVLPARLPADADGRTGTNAKRRKPYDHVLADSDLERFRVAARIGSAEFPDGLVFDTRVWRGIEDLPPARRDDSGAPNMQHMAVVREFAVPATGR